MALSACGQSTNNTTPTPTATAPAAAANGSGFCAQAAATVAQLSHLGTGMLSVTPGATPNVTSIQQLFATAASAIDSLDSSAPSQIAAAFHTLRSAYDQANAHIQAATTLQQLSAAVPPLDTASVKSAATEVKTYLQGTCGVATPTP